MALKDSYSKEDWARLVGAPMLAGMAVTAADPGGLWGAIRESAAAAKGLMAQKASINPLIAEIVAAFETSEGRDMARGVLTDKLKGKKPAEMVDAAIAELGALSGLVASKSPEAAAGFRDWLQGIAKDVAEAGTEGGFMGFGGEKVSAKEAATIDRLKSALAL